MNWELLVRIAGAGLLLIVVANFIAPGMLGYRENLERCDRFFGQVFAVHAAYIILTVGAMGVFCLWRPEFFREGGEVGRALAGFMALFWTSRVITQLFHYDRATKRRYPVWNAVFVAAFGCLGGLFLLVVCMP